MSMCARHDGAADGLGEARWTVWTIEAHLLVTNPSVLAEAQRMTVCWLDQVEAAASRFRPDSEVCRLARTGAANAAISPLLAELIAAALDAARATDGAVDPTLGNVLQQLGYDRDIHLCRDQSPGLDVNVNVAFRPAATWRRIRLIGDRLWLPRGVLLDLGATAKALAADRAAEQIADVLEVGVLVGLGGDLRTAGEQAPDSGWVINVQDGPDEPAAAVRLDGATALATSSTLHRTWQQGGRPMHHVMDPSTCGPARRVWRTASVAASSCLWANTLSTASLVWAERAPTLLCRAGATARLVARDKSVITLGGWPE